MNILLTGANGFLGKTIAKELTEKYILYNLSKSSGYYKVSLDKEIPFFKQKFDLVVHSAGKAHSVPKTEVECKQFQDTNVTGTLNLLRGLEKTAIPKQFVFISSVSVYGLEEGTDINEEFPLVAKDPYSTSKIEAEALITKWCRSNIVVCTILRLPLVVGKNPPGNLGAMLKAINNGYYFNIDGGKARKSMVLAEDVASFIMKVAPVGGIYNLTDGYHPTFNELSSVISESTSKKKPLNMSITIAKFIGKLGDLSGDILPINSLKLKKITSDLTFDDTNARIDLNWNPQSVIAYLKKNNV